MITTLALEAETEIAYLLCLGETPPFCIIEWQIKVKVKWARYRPGVSQWVGRGIALLLHDRSTRMGWVVNITPRPRFTPGKDAVPILQEARWASGSVWTGG